MTVITLHGPVDDRSLLVYCTELRCLIPYTRIRFDTLEVPDIYENTAAVMFINPPRSVPDDQLDRYRWSVLTGVPFYVEVRS